MFLLKVFENIYLTGPAAPVLLHYINQEKRKGLPEYFLCTFEVVWKVLFYFVATLHLHWLKALCFSASNYVLFVFWDKTLKD